MTNFSIMQNLDTKWSSVEAGQEIGEEGFGFFCWRNC